MASLIRSGGGIALRDLLLDKNYLAQHLLRIPGTSVESVALLIDPSDHQDVPKAVRLLEAIISLAELPTTNLNPTDMKANRLLTLLGVMLHSLITPSTNVNLNLQEQMTRLATYAHLSFAMFRLHGTSFSSNQLYADCQAMIKNAFFCVAKQQLLDPERPFYLMQGGDDRLEGNFCETRVDSKHQPNVDIVQLTYKEAAAMDRREIFDRHPDWDRGHRRLKFYNDTAVDHVNPRSWKGNVTCGPVNLKHAWMDGRKVAESALDTAKINDINFDTIFVTGGLDMLQPQHRGIFPAVATDKDRSIPDEFLENSTATAPRTPSQDTEMEDEVEIELDDLLPEVNAEEAIIEQQSHWIEYEGEMIHKASLIRVKIHVDRNQTGKKSKDRNRRVQGIRTYTQHGHMADLDTNDIYGNTFTHGSLAATLVKSGDSLCLGILSVTGLHIKDNKVSQVDIGEMQLTSAKIKVTGQIQILRSISPGTWIWTGEYANLPAAKTLTGAAAAQAKDHQFVRKAMTVSVPSYFIYPINPDTICTTNIPGWEDTVMERTWKYNGDSLVILADGIWQRAQTAGDSADPMAPFFKCGVNTYLPYRDESGE